jgi:predicted O-methyltransferase YrrM
LYETVRKHRPKSVCEVGTWHGGGSTFFIAQALHDNGFGILYSSEINREAQATARREYARVLPHLLPHVKFLGGSSTDVFPEVLKQIRHLDLLLLDGTDDSSQTVKEFLMFEPYLRTGAIFVAHDWDHEKMQLLRPLFERWSDWKLESSLTAPHSLGFAIYCRVKESISFSDLDCHTS